MISRAACKLEKALVPYSRQSLPRPARLYSTATKRNNAPALATQWTTPPSADYAAFMPSHENFPNNVSLFPGDMQNFLRRRTPYTLLPTPLPNDRTSPLNDLYFADSHTQDLFAVIGACLHNLYDVPRAKQIFERLRAKQAGDPLLVPQLYNSFLETYVNMAMTKGADKHAMWIQDACRLFESMEEGTEKVEPTAGTYAIMLLTWSRFHPESDMLLELPSSVHPTTLLKSIIDRQIPISHVVSDRVFSSSRQAVDIIKLLSKAAVDLNLTRVVNELGQAEAIGREYVDPLENVPEVLPVLRIKKENDVDQTQKGADATADGTDVEVPFNLNNLRKHLAQVAFARRVLPEDVAARQKLLEESVYDVAVERLKHQSDIFESLGLDNQGLRQVVLQRWMWDWHEKLLPRLEAEIKKIVMEEESYRSNRVRLGPFLSLVKPEKLSMITILETMQLQGSGGVRAGMKTARALLSVGKAVEIEYKAQMCRKNNIQIPAHPRAGEHGFFTRYGYRDLYMRRLAARQFMENTEEWTSDWTQLLRVQVGSFLVDCLMDVATVLRTGVDKRTGEVISEVQPAFFHGYEYVRGQKLGVIKLNPVVAERMAKDGLREIHPRHLPMLIKPKPWLSHDKGGYLFNRTSAMRFKDSQEQIIYLKHASSLGNVELVYAGLDVLGSTPWKINRNVFDIVLKVWNSGERLCKIPPAVFDDPEPEKPPNYETDLKARSVYLQRQRAYNNSRSNNHSERCSVNYKIEIARAFLGDTMYLPHNLDFRGRAYPIPPHLNHIGDDLSRGLLMFAEERPLGERGLRWLKIHLANLYGFDKGNFDERENFVMSHLDDIYDSAERPLEGKRWWTTAEDPWQCLATCMELSAALKSGDPCNHMSSLPVHQDGTCNGLQHYAALGGDSQGAAQVNLSVTDRPSDVYTYVAEMVEKAVAEDAEKGEKWAKQLLGKISRKIVKQTVMTTVYGVTFVGARDQIEKQVKDAKIVNEEDAWLASSYLAKQTLACIGNLFSGAKDIQVWLNTCARLIARSIPPERLPEASGDRIVGQLRDKRRKPVANRLAKEQMTTVVWTTPLGLPIVQPYRKTKRKQIMTALQTVYISDPNSPAEVNSSKQATAFPPNFIHSLDATHMMLTALECRTQGLTFASVHDSYWTHAADIDNMSKIIRDTFIALHSSDILERLQSEFHKRYAGYKVAVAPLRTQRWAKLLRGVQSTPLDFVPASTEEDTAEASSPASEICDVEEGDDDVEVHESEQKTEVKTRRKRRTGRGTSATDFILLTDLLPPLPKKGNFDVETIKRSQYFFS